jgi:hypothetical protein
MRKTMLVATAIAAGLTAGCATGKASSVSTPGSAEPSSCRPPTGTTSIIVDETDNGRTVCARVSQRVEVYLHGTSANKWSAITASAGPLQPATSGKLSLQVGVTGAAFTAVSPGEADVVSSRPMCNVTSAASDCPTVVRFRVTVSVRN